MLEVRAGAVLADDPWRCLAPIRSFRFICAWVKAIKNNLWVEPRICFSKRRESGVYGRNHPMGLSHPLNKLRALSFE